MKERITPAPSLHAAALGLPFGVWAAVCALSRGPGRACAVPVGVGGGGPRGPPLALPLSAVGEADERISLSVYVYF